MKINDLGAFVVVVLLFLFPARVVGQIPETIDSSLSPDRIESAISFLEDSQKVAALTRQLRLLADARRLMDMAPAIDASAKDEGPSFNLFRKGKMLLSDWKHNANDLALELQGVIGRGQNMQTVLTWDIARERFVTLLIMIVIAAAVGSAVAFVLWRAGRRMQVASAVDRGRLQRPAGIVSLLLIRGSTGGGAALTFYLLSLFPVGPLLQHFFSIMAHGYLIYTFVMTFFIILFSPNIPRLRSIPCSDTEALHITRRCTTLFRLSLLMFILYQTARTLDLTITVRWVTVVFQAVMTVMIPYTLYHLRPIYVQPFRDNSHTAKRPRALNRVIDFILSKLYLLTFFYSVALLGVTIAGSDKMYAFFIRRTISTLLVVLVGWVPLVLWRNALQGMAGVLKSFLSHYGELQSRFTQNIKIIGVAGYAVITAAILLIFVKMWDLQIGNLWTSDIPVVQVALRVTVIIAGAWILVQVTYFLISRFQNAAQTRMLQVEGANTVEIEKRVSTLGGICRKIITVSIMAGGVIMIMDELGFDIKAMVAGVGIVGLAVGFGAQNLVRDVISGLFVIFENRIRVGDVAIINGTAGLVEQVNLRTSVLRGNDGTIHVFPNGAINSLSNMTHEYSYYVFNIGVAYKEDTDRVVNVLRQIGTEIREDPEFRDAIIGPLEIDGVDAFAESAVMIKARIKTAPIRQWFVGREINRRIKKRFDELGIVIPYPHRTIYLGTERRHSASAQAALKTGNPVTGGEDEGRELREELKKIIREVLDERQRGDEK